MRILLPLVTAAACGKVHSDITPTPTDPPDAQPDALVSPALDAPNGTPPCTTRIANAALPVWFGNDGFELAKDPAGSGAWVWVSGGSMLPVATAFVVPYHDGDQITGLTFVAYGDASPNGLQSIEVTYRQDATSGPQILAKTNDLGRGAQWGQVTFPNFQPAALSESGLLWVRFTVTEFGYYIGKVTPVLERPCSK